ncbi:hypothetical protein [Roseovarius sp.]|uniref:hypothetical protein n=1 Tax=Roseovarius sp. TaxID=1486281 RepID=UPI003BAC544C
MTEPFKDPKHLANSADAMGRSCKLWQSATTQYHFAVRDMIREQADALEALQAENARLREIGQFLLRAFDHINENPRRDPVDDLFLMVRDTSTISSVSDARAALGDDT